MPAWLGTIVRWVDAVIEFVGTGFSRWAGLIASNLFDSLYFFGLRRPHLLRVISGAARRWTPSFSAPGFMLLSRADDVREVFLRGDDFLLSPVNERKILSGDFVISLDPSAQYHDERELMRAGFPENHIDLLKKYTTAAAERLLPKDPTAGLAKRKRPQPRRRRDFDIVPFAERVTVQLVRDFWGLDPVAARSSVVSIERGEGLDEGAETMRLWLRKLAAIIGSREPAPFGVKEVGDACAAEFGRYVKEACEARAAEFDAAQQPREPEDVLGRLVWHRPRAEATWRTAAGLIVTGTAVVTKAFTHAFEQLARRPGPLKLAIEAAHRHDDAVLAMLLMEALRFNTVFPMVARYCPRNTTLAYGTPRETDIPAGTMVAVSPTGAMFDPEVVDDPESFSIHRRFIPSWGAMPGSSYADWAGVYMHFGSGVHWCPGDEMALMEMTAMCGVLLRGLPEPEIPGVLPELWRPLRYDGPAVWRLKVVYG